MNKFDKIQFLLESLKFDYPTDNPNDYINEQDKTDTHKFLIRMGWEFNKKDNKWYKGEKSVIG